jgi:heat shock protein HtpX
VQNIYEVAAANRRKSFLIMALFVVFITAAVYFISTGLSIYWGYEAGSLGIVGVAFIISGIMSIGSYYFSDKIVLGISGARPADRNRDFEFYTVTENLALAAGLPKPKLYVIDDTAMNAFATGRNPDHAVVVATTGLLAQLNRTELEGVIGHELTHVKNYDILLMSVVAVLIGTVALLADFFLRASFWGGGRRDRDKGGGVIILVGLIFAILAPIIGQLIKLAISRRREFSADAGAVAITRQPSGLISALQKISHDHEPLEAANKATAHLYIADPFKGKIKDARANFSSLFNTHPPVENRIEALKKMA